MIRRQFAPMLVTLLLLGLLLPTRPAKAGVQGPDPGTVRIVKVRLTGSDKFEWKQLPSDTGEDLLTQRERQANWAAKVGQKIEKLHEQWSEAQLEQLLGRLLEEQGLGQVPVVSAFKALLGYMDGQREEPAGTLMYSTGEIQKFVQVYNGQQWVTGYVALKREFYLHVRVDFRDRNGFADDRTIHFTPTYGYPPIYAKASPHFDDDKYLQDMALDYVKTGRVQLTGPGCEGWDRACAGYNYPWGPWPPLAGNVPTLPADLQELEGEDEAPRARIMKDEAEMLTEPYAFPPRAGMGSNASEIPDDRPPLLLRDDAIPAAGDVVRYPLQFQEGEVLKLEATSLGASDVDLYLYAPDGSTAGESTGPGPASDFLIYKVPANGTYTVAVKGASNARFRVAVTHATPGLHVDHPALFLGSTDGVLDAYQFIYKVELEPGVYAFDLAGTLNEQMHLKMLDGNKDPFYVPDMLGSGLGHQHIALDFSTGGTYYIVVSGPRGTHFRLTMSDAPPGSHYKRPLPFSGTAEKSIDQYEGNYFGIPLNSGDTVRFKVERLDEVMLFYTNFYPPVGSAISFKATDVDQAGYTTYKAPYQGIYILQVVARAGTHYRISIQH